MTEKLLDHIRQQPEEARAFDRLRQLTLLLGRHRSDAARHDLAALRHVALQKLNVLEVDLRRVGTGERAGLAPAEERTAGAALWCECHGLFLHRRRSALGVAALVVAARPAWPVTAVT